MPIKKLKNGSLVVPKRIESENGIIGDTVEIIKQDSVEYEKFLKDYEKEQKDLMS